jgi:hypothetical protein
MKLKELSEAKKGWKVTIETEEGEGASPEFTRDLKKFMRDNGITRKNLGEGDGDWPEFEYVGSKDALEKLVDEFFADNRDDAEELKSQIEERE